MKPTAATSDGDEEQEQPRMMVTTTRKAKMCKVCPFQ